MTDAVDVALKDVGYVEQGGPHGNDGNITKMWAELEPDFQGEPWCAAAVSYWEKHAGTPLPAIDHPWGYSYCPNAVNFAKAHKLWHTVSEKAQRGWIGFACWDGTGVAEHTFLVTADLGNSIHTVEGNTSPGNNGSQNNGGGVYERVRPKSLILGYFQPPNWRQRVVIAIKQAVTKPHANPYSFGKSPDIKLGDVGEAVKAVQWAASMPFNQIDGVFGPITKKYVQHFQFQHLDPNGKPLVQDGEVGPKTKFIMVKVIRRY